MTFLDPDEMAAIERELDRAEREHYAEATVRAINDSGGVWLARPLTRWERLLDWWLARFGG